MVGVNIMKTWNKTAIYETYGEVQKDMDEISRKVEEDMRRQKEQRESAIKAEKERQDRNRAASRR